MFDPGTVVDAGEILLKIRNPRTGRAVALPALHCLTWKEGVKSFIHCLEFDLLADGATMDETIDRLVEVIAEQMRMAQEEHVQLLHPAPREYWDKLFELHRNRLIQTFLDSPPRTARDLIVRERDLVHA